MGQVLRNDNIPPLLRTSATVCTLASTFMGQPTRITIGGQQYALSSNITMSTATSGFGGLDTGSVSSGLLQFWFVYAVVQGGAVGLVASQSAVAPTGFTNLSKVVGAFCNTGDDSAIGSTVTLEGAETEWINVITPANYVSNIASAGTNAFHKLAWKRIGDTMYVDWFMRQGTTGVSSGGAVGLSPVGGVTIDATKNGSGTGRVGAKGMSNWYDRSATLEAPIYAYVAASNSIRFCKNASPNDLSSTGDMPTGSDDDISSNISFPVVGWGKTLFG